MSEITVEKSRILERKAIIKNADMTEDMQQDAIDCATMVCMVPGLKWLPFGCSKWNPMVFSPSA